MGVSVNRVDAHGNSTLISYASSILEGFQILPGFPEKRMKAKYPKIFCSDRQGSSAQPS